MPRYKVDEYGNPVFNRRTGEPVLAGIPNLSFEHLFPTPPPHKIRCRTCQKSLKLYPVNLDEKVTHYECLNCNRRWQVSTIEECFRRVCDELGENNNIKIVKYNGYYDSLTIISNEYESKDGDRRTATRKTLTEGAKKAVYDMLINEMELRLGIIVISKRLQDIFEYKQHDRRRHRN